VARSAGDLPPEKKAILDHIAQLREQGRQGFQPVPDPKYRPPSDTPTPWRSGIFESGNAPFPSSVYYIENQWQDVVEGEHVNVFAGEYTQDPSQGVVMLALTSLDGKALSVKESPTPTKVGALKIVSANGFVLRLISTKGSSFTMDAATQTLTPAAP
jgi:hypothetical protein